MRTFVGIELPMEMIALARLARETIVELDPSWRSEKWVPAENLHVTLAFLGEVDQSQLDRLIEGMGRIASAQFVLDGPELAAVPSPRRASMCWLRLRDPRGGARMLADEIARVAEDAGIAVDERPGAFRPHVTLVRARGRRSLPTRAPELLAAALREQDSLSMSVSSATVFTSTLASTGPVYERVAVVPLRTS